MVAALTSAGVAAAYRSADGLANTTRAQPGAGSGFGAALSRAMEQAVDAGRTADTTATQALTGQGSVTDVVMAVSRAELALQTTVAVRDKVVAAYQDVMRMPI
ncbi:flagellar hook-basal body complex protein FliE [Plastoroseomonas hellenica]|uniref:Flagellar hook-basal body complex protein FliE n=1 Tax=Plastoroseomonas hellenica TaxID=2687306 RepID=A0ABS5EZK9_9PROT|nr:flagellar hook-basal body complex protein FliE [Plastoroseomonas hellenica]MBR0643439.1 flagellar hook-basal body complex protein FliE [Plastoroseomonas hellenica]MBR0665729.1 flagellar hook-basal body complex protein FliE [Plastoroseomonas hellenica]